MLRATRSLFRQFGVPGLEADADGSRAADDWQHRTPTFTLLTIGEDACRPVALPSPICPPARLAMTKKVKRHPFTHQGHAYADTFFFKHLRSHRDAPHPLPPPRNRTSNRLAAGTEARRR